MAGRGCSIRLAVRTARELPAPRVSAHLRQTPLRRPSEQLLCQAGIGPALGNIPGAARANSADDRAPAGLFKSLDDVEDRISLAGPEIQGEHSRMPIEVVERRQVTICEIRDMNIVAYSGTVRCGIVGAPDSETLALACRNLRDHGHQIIWHALRILADQSGLIGTLCMAESN